MPMAHRAPEGPANRQPPLTAAGLTLIRIFTLHHQLVPLSHRTLRAVARGQSEIRVTLA